MASKKLRPKYNTKYNVYKEKIVNISMQLVHEMLVKCTVSRDKQ